MIKKKIALVGYQLAKGGLEKVLADMSIILNDEETRADLFLLENSIEYEYKGKLFNLGVYSKWSKYFKLKSILQKERYDYILDFRYRINPYMEFVFFEFIYRNNKVIYTIHSTNIKSYLTNNKSIQKRIIAKAYKIICVSKSVQKEVNKITQIDKIQVIYNFFIKKNVLEKISDQEVIVPRCNYILFVGRLEKNKQCEKLIDAYFKTNLPKKNIHLFILGAGNEEVTIKEKVLNSKFSSLVHFFNFQLNPFPFYNEALYLVHPSDYEGFGLVVLESLSCGTPVVAFDESGGVSELIIDNYNGLLAKKGSFDDLIDKMNTFVKEEKSKIYATCKENALQSVVKFESKTVKKNWKKILK